MKSSKLKSFFGRHWQAIGGGFINYLSESANSTATPKASYVGNYKGSDIYKADISDYYATVNGVEWHFRANPLEAANVTIESRYKWTLSTLARGPGVSDFSTGKVFNKAVILLDPDENSRATLAATEISAALGATGWTPDVAFTKPSSQRPDIPVMNLSTAQYLNETTFVIYVAQSDSAPSPASVILYSSNSAPSAALFILGRDYDNVDRAADAVKMYLIGWTQ
jgi:hypothetical protein